MKNFCKISLVFCISALIFSIPVKAEENIKDIQAHNPDGKKYEFVRDYISSLKYLEQNSRRVESNLKNFSDSPEGLQAQINVLVNDNLNLRVARNIMDNYIHQNNELMVKIVGEFVLLCDAQIEINNKERNLLKKLYEVQSGDKSVVYSREQFVSDLEKVLQERKESLKVLLKSSVLVSRLVISDKADAKGNFSYLGITENERKNLLAQLDEFQGEEFSGELRAGQSFLQGSVTVIRKVLTDNSLIGSKSGVY